MAETFLSPCAPPILAGGIVPSRNAAGDPTRRVAVTDRPRNAVQGHIPGDIDSQKR
jgi:hypothetical protein